MMIAMDAWEKGERKRRDVWRDVFAIPLFLFSRQAVSLPPRYISYIKSYDPRRCGGGGMEGEKIRDARFSFFFFSPPPPSFFATGDDN